ncbi:helix-turn-helix transcriptional regulator [Miniimonas arenae]|uniref:Helix-turn-helix transcriptional regulator n=1 Tax=Miniimonas arenae TaxID=676201 RepID=A0A5C5BAB0_9MICO|nr:MULTISPECIES: helix-turn-helix transcriptional regulator [Miniimonas]TNU73631.1 helix-turn-helix transcriptional regulator [Miniimonas arenae]
MPADRSPDRDLAVRLGHRLARLRTERGLTQEQVAAAAGINRNHYQLLESGLSDRAKNTPANPRLSTLVALSDVLRTTVPELVVDLFPDDAAKPLEYRETPHP